VTPFALFLLACRPDPIPADDRISLAFQGRSDAEIAPCG
jgi:hypothetical protein